MYLFLQKPCFSVTMLTKCETEAVGNTDACAYCGGPGHHISNCRLLMERRVKAIGAMSGKKSGEGGGF
jgi:hypothetical protein